MFRNRLLSDDDVEKLRKSFVTSCVEMSTAADLNRILDEFHIMPWCTTKREEV